MIKQNRYAQLKFNTQILPADWDAFINECGFKWSKRSTEDYVQWKELRGKGYQIWISIPIPKRIGEKVYWEYVIDSTKHLPDGAIQLLEELIIGLQNRFPLTEIKKTAANKT